MSTTAVPCQTPVVIVPVLAVMIRPLYEVALVTAPAIATEPVNEAVAEIVCPLIAPEVIVSAPMSIAPKPEVIEPAFRAPVPVIAVLTASLVSTRAASLPSNLSSSADEMVVAPVVMSFEPIARAVPISASETSIAVVMAPAAD